MLPGPDRQKTHGLHRLSIGIESASNTGITARRHYGHCDVVDDPAGQPPAVVVERYLPLMSVLIVTAAGLKVAYMSPESAAQFVGDDTAIQVIPESAPEYVHPAALRPGLKSE